MCNFLVQPSLKCGNHRLPPRSSQRHRATALNEIAQANLAVVDGQQNGGIGD
jgi:hypothetical protein